jgi:hypothetical protein
MAKCRFHKKNGTNCNADAQAGKDTCVFHDPQQSANVSRARRAGGINRNKCAAVLPPQTPDKSLANAPDVSNLLAESINQLRRGELDPRIANAIGYLAGIQLRSFEQGVIQERIRKMEEALGLMPRPQIVTPDSEQKQRETRDGND